MPFTGCSLIRYSTVFFLLANVRIIRSKPNTNTPPPGSQPELGRNQSFYGSLEQICLPVIPDIPFFSITPPAGRLWCLLFFNNPLIGFFSFFFSFFPLSLSLALALALSRSCSLSLSLSLSLSFARSPSKFISNRSRSTFSRM